ncbi:MAG: FAD-binding protein [Acidobacteria bacterium]|nr:FAD-binding protein [Acidobacteriota bacterium]
MNIRRYNTDVLVVGGGGAATAATIAAHEKGARTMLAVKGQFGVPGVRGAGATSDVEGPVTRGKVSESHDEAVRRRIFPQPGVDR